MAMLLPGLGACATDGASQAPFTDPPVAYSIGVGAQPGIELRVDGAVIELHNYPRFANPYCRADFGAKVYEIELTTIKVLAK